MVKQTTVVNKYPSMSEKLVSNAREVSMSEKLDFKCHLKVTCSNWP